MNGSRYFIEEHRGTLLALAIFLVMFTLYSANHPAGFTPNVVQTAANKGVLLALVAIAQTFVVLTAGIDLSVGMVMILTNCLASYLVVGGVMTTSGGVAAVLLTGVLCGAINGAIVIFGRLQPIVTTIATGAVFYGIALWLRPFPGSNPDFNGGLADALTGKVFSVVPASLVFLLAVILVIWLPFRRSVLGRAVYATGSSENAAYMSGVPILRAKMLAYVLSGLMAAIGGLFLTFFTYSGEASLANGNTYTLYSIAAVVLGGVSLFGGRGSAVGAIFGALAFRAIGDLLFVFDLDPLWQPLFQGVVLMVGGIAWFGPLVPGAQPGLICSTRGQGMSSDLSQAKPGWTSRIDIPVATAFGCIIFLLLIGSIYSTNFLSPAYLLQQLKVGAFLGIIATGMMLVILLGPD